MKPIEIIVIVIASSIVMFTIVYNIIRKKQKKSCSACSDCKSCVKYGCSQCEYAKRAQQADKKSAEE
ncbi:MAG: hypothetical protein EOM87_04490 [Clostridia bacterium]|nr:hypothetical protein [Clostridia bacterium]